MKNVILTFMVLMLVAMVAVDVQGGDFNDIPGGDFSSPAFSGGKPQQLFAGEGYWAYHESVNATASVTGTGEDRHAELQVVWYPRGASMWYVSDDATPSNGAWKVSADLKVISGGNGDRSFEIGSSSSMPFQLKFTSSSGQIDWTAGSQNGTITPTNTIYGAYKNVSIRYNGATGAAKALIGSDVIFDVTTETGIACTKIMFLNMTDASTYDTGTFHIDNVVVPPRGTVMILL